ncbi:MAG TPA: hypothetical protein VFQ52_09750, partial [Rhizomicrobium sp.]|nr:hypothetical protein [Rhizomicrobium sp.]
MSRRGILLVALPWAIIAIAAGVYLMRKSAPDNSMTAAMSSEETGSIPTPQYLFERPDVFKAAEQKCQHNSDPSSLYCSNVQRAESLRMADQYRRAAQPKR